MRYGEWRSVDLFAHSAMRHVEDIERKEKCSRSRNALIRTFNAWLETKAAEQLWQIAVLQCCCCFVWGCRVPFFAPENASKLSDAKTTERKTEGGERIGHVNSSSIWFIPAPKTISSDSHPRSLPNAKMEKNSYALLPLGRVYSGWGLESSFLFAPYHPWLSSWVVYEGGRQFGREMNAGRMWKVPPRSILLSPPLSRSTQLLLLQH